MTQKMVDFLNALNGFRKSIVMLLLMTIGVIFRVKGLLSGDNFVSLFSTTVVSYFGANSIEHVTSMVKDHLASKMAISQAANVPLAPSEDGMTS